MATPDRKGLTQPAFARAVGVTRQRINQLIKIGLPTLPDGSIDRAIGEKWIVENLDPGAHGRKRSITDALASAKPPKSEKVEGNAMTERTFSVNSNSTMVEINKAKELEKLKRLQRDNNAKDALLISREKVKQAVFARFRLQRDVIGNWPSRVAVQMADHFKLDPAEVFVYLSKAVRELTEDLSRSPLDDLQRMLNKGADYERDQPR